MADLQLTIRTENLDKVREALARLSGPQARQAYANAINDTAFKVRGEMQKELRSRFDRVTPFIANAPKVFKATPDKLTASIAPTLDSRNLPSTGGKVGVDPQQVLQEQEFGGSRRDKKSEVALRRAGILLPGWQTAIPRDPYPGSDDGRGNLKGSFLVQVISYFQAFGEQGYKANMTEKGFKRLHKNGRKKDVAMGVKGWTKNVRGHRYIVAYGRLRGGARQTRNGEYDQRASNLKPGIWAISGTGGGIVKPVLMFVRPGTYRPLISMDRIAQAADLQDYLDRRVRARVRNLAEGKPA